MTLAGAIKHVYVVTIRSDRWVVEVAAAAGGNNEGRRSECRDEVPAQEVVVVV